MKVRQDRRGVAALEFALLAPVLIVMMFGTFELVYAFRMQAKLNTTAGALAEFVANAGAVTAPAGTLQDLCNGAKLNLLPFKPTIMTANVASITNDVPANRVAGSTDTTTITTYLDWEVKSDCGQDGSNALPPKLGLTGAVAIAENGRSLLTRSGAVSAGSSTLLNGASAIVVQVNYQYANIRTNFFSQSYPLIAKASAKPRTVSTVTCTTPGTTTLCNSGTPL